MTFDQINQAISKKDLGQVYLLQGEEPYFIDLLTKRFQEDVLNEMEREFNLTIVYGHDVNTSQLVETLKRFPMMAEKQVVILKEAHKVKEWEGLEEYVKNPTPSTVFVVAHKYKKFDGRKAISKLFKKHAVFTSDPIKEYQLGKWIHDYLVSRGFKIGQHASEVIAGNLGSDLSKIVHAADKMSLNYPPGTTITGEIIEECVGIDREYNVFNLSDAILARNYERSLAISLRLALNKETPSYAILPLIFGNFQKLMGLSFAKFEKIPADNLATAYGINPYHLSKFQKAAQVYGGKKIRENIQILLDYDLMNKGVGGSFKKDEDLYKELIYKLMH